MATTSIEWTELSWNPVTGCSKVSPGCAHCSIPFFFKQWGGKRKKRAGRVLEGRTWDEHPAAAGAAPPGGKPGAAAGSDRPR